MDKSDIAIITSILAILAAAGIPTGQMLLSAPELSHYYVCPLINDAAAGHYKIFYFDRLATSGQRGYPTISSTKGYVDCKSDTDRANWILVSEYAKSLGVDPNALLNGYLAPSSTTTTMRTTTTVNDIPSPQVGEQCWFCGHSGCRGCSG